MIEKGGDVVGQGICPADVISLCEADGQIRPLRVRYMDEEQLYRRLDVDQVLRRDEIRHTGAESQLFLCRATVGDSSWLFELKYVLRSHCWYITGRIY